MKPKRPQSRNPMDPALFDEPTLSEADGIRYLHFNSHWIQGAMRVARPSELVLSYTQQMMAWMLFRVPRASDRLGILGLGAGSLLRFCMRHTRAQLDIVECNPRVTAMAHMAFRMPDSPRVTVDHMDARDWVAQPVKTGCYTALMVDLYDGQAQGPVCSEAAFYRGCHDVLDDRGIMAVNLFGNHRSFAPNIRRIRAAFDGHIVELPEVDEGNAILLAFKNGAILRAALARGPARMALAARARQLQRRTGLPAEGWIRYLPVLG